MTKQTTLKVSGMHCSGCAGNVERVLRRVKGVSSAKVDLAAAQAVVEFNPNEATEKDLAAAITKAGYGATESK